MPGVGSPDIGNYAIGKGFLLFQPDDAVSFYHVGNVPSFQFTPKVETLEHFSSMEGTKLKDQTIVLSKGGDLKMDMEEMTARNIALMVLGDIDNSDPTRPKVNILSRSSLAGALQYYGTNEVGPRWFGDFKRVVFNPSGAFDPIGDKYTVMSVTGSLEAVDGVFGTLELLPNVDTIAPTNVLAPYIGSQIQPASDPVVPFVGEVLTAIIGAWIGYNAITYQWNLAGSPISGADKKVYTVQAGDTGDVISVTITASNAIGDTVVTTANTAAVHA